MNNPLPQPPLKELTPIGTNERINALDVIRGVALFGIALMNIEFFSKTIQDLSAPGIDPSLHGLNYATDAIIYVLVQNKFWTLFSLLFGMGFALMIERANASQRPFAIPYLRRCLGLLVLGFLHSVLFWSGDILISYALGASVLLLARQLRRFVWGWMHNKPPQPMSAIQLAMWGAGLYSFPLVLIFLNALSFGQQAGSIGSHTQYLAQMAERSIAQGVYSHGSYLAVFAQRWKETLHQLATWLGDPYRGALRPGCARREPALSEALLGVGVGQRAHLRRHRARRVAHRTVERQVARGLRPSGVSTG